MKIRKKLLVINLSLTLVPLLLLGAITYVLVRQSLIQTALTNLDGATSRLTVTLQDLAERDQVTIVTLSNESIVKNLFVQPVVAGATTAVPPPDLAAATATFAQPATFTRMLRIDPNMRTFLVLDLTGKVIASSDPARVGESDAGQDFFEQGKAAPTGNLYFKTPAGDELMHLSAPVYDSNNTIVGVVVDEHYPKIVLELTGDTAGLGKTGEILLVKKQTNGDLLFMTPTRFNKDAAMVTAIAHDDTTSALVEAENGSPGEYTNTIDYRGVPVYAASEYDSGLGLGVEVKIDRTEALAPLTEITFEMLAIILFAALMISIITYFVAKSIAYPIVALTNVTKEISMGKMDVGFEKATTKDEIGDLSRSFERILISLKLAMRGAKTKDNQKKTDLI